MDYRKVVGVARDSSGNEIQVSVTVPESSNEVLEHWELYVDLAWACESNGLHLLRVIETDYVSKDADK